MTKRSILLLLAALAVASGLIMRTITADTATQTGLALKSGNFSTASVTVDQLRDSLSYVFGGLNLENASDQTLVIEQVVPLHVDAGLTLDGVVLLPARLNKGAVFSGVCGKLPLTGGWGSVPPQGYVFKPDSDAAVGIGVTQATGGRYRVRDVRVVYRAGTQRFEQVFPLEVGWHDAAPAPHSYACTREKRLPPWESQNWQSDR